MFTTSEMFTTSVYKCMIWVNAFSILESIIKATKEDVPAKDGQKSWILADHTPVLKGSGLVMNPYLLLTDATVDCSYK